MAMSLFPSRGLDIYGFEIKVNRNDWLRELKVPEKAEETMCGVDYIFIVTPPDIIKKGEVPEKWGHIVARKSRLRHVKPAERQRAESSSVGRAFVASILRQAHLARDKSPEATALRNEFLRGVEEGKTSMKESSRLEAECCQQKIINITNRIDLFEKSSGINIDNWEAGLIGETVKTLMSSGINFANLGAEILSMNASIKQIQSEVTFLSSVYDLLSKFKPSSQEKGHGSSGETGEGSGDGDSGARGEECSRVRETGSVERGLEGQGEGTRRSP
jgi:hypothetical protein